MMKRLMLHTFFCLCFASPTAQTSLFADTVTSASLSSTTAGNPKESAPSPGTREEDAATASILPAPTGWTFFHRPHNPMKAFKDTPARMKSNYETIQHYVLSSGHTTGSLPNVFFEKLRAKSSTSWPSLTSSAWWPSEKAVISQLTDICIRSVRSYLSFAWRTVVHGRGSWNELMAFHAADWSLLLPPLSWLQHFSRDRQTSVAKSGGTVLPVAGSGAVSVFSPPPDAILASSHPWLGQLVLYLPRSLQQALAFWMLAYEGAAWIYGMLHKFSFPVLFAAVLLFLAWVIYSAYKCLRPLIRGLWMVTRLLLQFLWGVAVRLLRKVGGSGNSS